ncbi:MAG: TetR/AcrR family transcriptional regulator [Anaerolineae bacterium]|nr:TetR/AcrR family transcriptional regulator [Anaerolineae bacterium]
MPPRKHIDRQRVLDVSIALADAHGFEAVTLAAVADQLGIRVPSLYNHISGLPGLRYEMAVWGVHRLGKTIRRAAVGKAGDNAILSVADAYRAFVHEHPGVYALTLRAPAPDQAELIAASQGVLDVVLAILEPYGLSQDAMLHVTRGLRSVIHGFVDLEIAGGFGLALDRDESYRHLIQIFIQGFHAWQRNDT